MSDRFSITDHTERGVVRVSCTGELDLAAVPALNDHLVRWLDDQDIMRLVVDLAETTFMDSVGLGALIRAQRQCTAVGKVFGVVDAKDEVARVLELTGLAKLLSLPAGTVVTPENGS